MVNTAEGSGRGGSVYSVCPPQPVLSLLRVGRPSGSNGQRSAGMSEQTFARGKVQWQFFYRTMIHGQGGIMMIWWSRAGSSHSIHFGLLSWSQAFTTTAYSPQQPQE